MQTEALKLNSNHWGLKRENITEYLPFQIQYGRARQKSALKQIDESGAWLLNRDAHASQCEINDLANIILQDILKDSATSTTTVNIFSGEAYINLTIERNNILEGRTNVMGKQGYSSVFIFSLAMLLFSTLGMGAFLVLIFIPNPVVDPFSAIIGLMGALITGIVVFFEGFYKGTVQ